MKIIKNVIKKCISLLKELIVDDLLGCFGVLVIILMEIKDLFLGYCKLFFLRGWTVLLGMICVSLGIAGAFNEVLNYYEKILFLLTLTSLIFVIKLFFQFHKLFLNQKKLLKGKSVIKEDGDFLFIEDYISEERGRNSSSFPLDDLQSSKVIFKDNVFCPTGKFVEEKLKKQ